MFSQDLLGEIYTDDRMRSVPVEYSSTVLRVVQDAVEKRVDADKSAAGKVRILRDVCAKE